MRVGRPSLSSERNQGRSPLVQTRLPHHVHEAFNNLVAQSGVSQSELLRQAVLLLLARNVSNDVPQPYSRDLREDRVELALMRALIRELHSNPDKVREIGRANLKQAQPDNEGLRALYREWATLIERPTESIAETILADTEHAHDLRQVAPFAGALTLDQRLEAIAEAKR